MKFVNLILRVQDDSSIKGIRPENSAQSVQWFWSYIQDTTQGYIHTYIPTKACQTGSWLYEKAYAAWH